MIYFCLSILMLSGIRDIFITSTPYNFPNFESFFGDGDQVGLNIQYVKLSSLDKLMQAFIICKDFIRKDDVCLIFGDNTFYCVDMQRILINAVQTVKEEKKADFGYYVRKPEGFRVVDFIMKAMC